MAASVQSRTRPHGAAVSSEPTVIGWQGLRFYLPPEWNITAFSMDRADGYLKVDSPGSMFVQVKWTQPGVQRARTLADLLGRGLAKLRRKQPAAPPDPELEPMLEGFLKQTAKMARKSKAQFDSRTKPETTEAGGQRTAIHFNWTGGGQGQGKIWHCRACGRVVIAQVVGQGRDNVGAVASQMFASFSDHAEDGWHTWALYDMVAGVPEDYALKSQKLMSGYLKLDFERRGGEHIRVERWGLANVARRKFTLAEWFDTTCGVSAHRVETDDALAQEHPATRATGSIRSPLAWIRALREGVLGFRRPAVCYDGCCWECPDTNKLYAVQVWHNRRTQGLLPEVVARCECH